MSIALVDLHCHVDLYPDHEMVIAESDRDRVYTLAVTTTPKAWPRNRELAACSGHVRVALGLHPQLVAERASELGLWEEYLEDARYVGEVGLDAGPRFFRSLDLQRRVFTRVLQCCAERGGKVLTVHSVRAAKAVLDLIEAHLPPNRGRVVLHWFTGTASEARRAVELGCYFSINAEMLRSERHRGLVERLPMERLLTETDGPFTKVDGRVARPRDVSHTVGALAQVCRTETLAMAATITANLKALVSAAPP